MLTPTAIANLRVRQDLGVLVRSRKELYATGCTAAEICAHIDGGRWQVIGQAVVLHNGELSKAEQWAAGVVNCGPRAILTSFSAAEALGLAGWERPEIHVLAPPGVAPPRIPSLPVVLHRTVRLRPDHVLAARRCHRIAPALVLAASSFASARPACGLLAAGVQQRLTSPPQLQRALDNAPRVRHRAALLAATHDIAMGADALSEIDFVRLCRENRLPAPRQQAVRVDANGRRRYLDAEWIRADGRRVGVEVDGAVHLVPRRWFADQLRQNELTLSGTLVLRFPSVVVRTESDLVVRQLRRALSAQQS